MKGKFNIADDLILPLDAVTQRNAFMGRIGSGKTYGATKLAEEMLGVHAQIVAIDPVGVWYGLRLAGDGKSPGLSIPVFGGLHGDVPLQPGSGAYVADLIVNQGMSVVLDVSQFEHDSDKAKFAADWCDRFFFRKKAAPSAVHIFLEECQEFIPQNQQRGEERMLHVFNRMAKLGRNFGIGLSLISQRPQEVNKKSLNLTECMFAFQMTGPQERKTIREWISAKGLDDDIDKVLPSLKVGHAHVWSPQWLQVSKVVHIGKKWTFNASATPEVGFAAVKRELAPIDLDKIRSDMAATIEEAKANDPAELKRKIASLEKQVQAAGKQQTADPAQIQGSIEAALRKRDAEIQGAFSQWYQGLQNRVSAMALSMHDLLTPFAFPGLSDAAIVVMKNDKVFPQRTVPAKNSLEAGDSSLSGPERRILNAIAWLNSIGVNDPLQTAVAFLAGYTVGGGAFNNPRGALKSKGLVEYLPGDRIRLTREGNYKAICPDTPLDAEQLQAMVLERLPGPEQKILTVLLEYPKGLSNEKLAELAGYSHGGGAYNNPRGRLRTLGLIDYRNGMVVPEPLLFLEDRA